MLPRSVWYYGKEEPLPQQKELRAGPLSLVYEEGDLRYIRLGDREMLRRVYVAVRDRNWGTVPPHLSNAYMNIGEDSFHIAYDVEHRQGDIDFFWKGTITGGSDGTITFAMDGVARSTFWRNRIGFCVLHPIRECAGARCRVEHVDGTVEEGTFPQFISPHQPFFDIQAISHEVMPGVWAEVRFAGDVFEMEDQRNWTDASYKTYCTPLWLPYPVEIQAGTRIAQTVTLSLQGPIASAERVREEGQTAEDQPMSFVLRSSSPIPLPSLGLGVASHGRPLNSREIERLRALHLSHLRVDLDLAGPGYEAALYQATAEAQALGVSLEIALFLSDEAERELKALSDLLARIRPPVERWLVFHHREKSTSERWAILAREILSHYDATVPIGAGTNAYFAELNRSRPPIQSLDAVCYSINPQVHAFDNASLVENLEAQAATVESARQFCGDRPICITPVTLRPRFNPDATGPEPPLPTGELPRQVDVRQMSLFGAGWTLGSIKYLAESGVASITYYETTGWRGVMETEDGSPLPDKFRSLPGMVFPLYHVFADVGEFRGGEVISSRSSHPLCVDGLALRKGNKTRVMLANFTAEPQTVIVSGLGERVRARSLDETNVEEAVQSPEAFRARAGELLSGHHGAVRVRLRPYAVISLDGV
ncbi:MAG: hypothetical protein RML36_02800 [Anaerolineae bacterium]|nr:hypothetical protein [Anaerolineae bacterium]MDW8098395.1 hypothetical protein [Anaerolineae bacterium]